MELELFLLLFLLISLSKQNTNECLVKYGTIVIRRRLFYTYNGRNFATKNDMKDEVINDCLRKNHCIVKLLTDIGIANSKLKNDPYQISNSETIDLSHLRRKNLNGKIIEGNKPIYECGKKVFNSYDSVTKFASKHNCRVVFSVKHLQVYNKNDPPACIKYIKDSDSMYLTNVEKWQKEFEEKIKLGAYLGKNSFSNNIWRKIWHNCNFKCYSANNYLRLKKNFKEEINEYRKAHGSQPLKITKYLNKIAQDEALKLASGINSLDSVDTKYGENSINVYYLLASLVVKGWYEEEEVYQYNTNMARKNARHFTSLVWRSTSELGIGVVRKDDKISIVLKFNPRGNVHQAFRNNVLRKRFKSF